MSGVDWPLLLSCFACLWHEAAESEDDVVELAGSESLHDFAVSWRLQNGIAPHPSVLLADYRDQHPAKKAAGKTTNRPAVAISTSDASPRRGD